MNTPSSADQQTLDQLRQRDQAAYQLLYRAYYPMIERMVVGNSGTCADAQDLFQDTLLILVGQLDNEQWTLTASLKTYLYAVAHRQWLARLRQQRRMEPLLANELKSPILDEPLPADEPTPLQRLTAWLGRITIHCQSLLRRLFLEEKELTPGPYKNVHTARNQRYKCLEQIRRVAGQDTPD